MKRLFPLVACVAACHRAAPPSPVPPAWTPVPAHEILASGLDPARLDSVTAYLRTQVDSAFPGAVVAVGRHGRIALLAALGHYAANDPRPVTPQTVYDLASLTKVISLTPACLQLAESGRLDLDAPVQRYLPEFRGQWKDSVRIRHLLTHSAGLAADLPLWDSTKTRQAALAFVDTAPLLTPPGTRYVYSDLSAIVLMQVVERITGRSLDHYVAEKVFGPLGMTATRYLPPASWLDHVAPTEVDTFFRHRLLVGEVHDESAARLGGVSGNAGLFSAAPDLARFAIWMLGRWHTDSVVREWTRRQGIPPGSTRALGWDTPSDSGYSSAGALLSRQSFGHTGYTGTSIWMDPTRDLFVILLSNRVNPTRANTKILQVRPHVADLVARAVVEDR